MGCLRCGCQYMKVIGKEIHCPQCGHIQGGKMVDNADLIEKAEDEIWQIIAKMHKANVRYEVVHQIFVEITKTLELQGYAENWLTQYNEPDAL